MNGSMWRRGFVAVSVLVMLALSAGAAIADTPIGSSGSVGSHHLRDTSSRPGVRCLYQDGAGGGDQDLYQLTVKPPVMSAVNATAQRDKQLVGWRALIQRRDPGMGFRTVAIGDMRTAWAWDDTPAVFYPRDYSVTPRYGSDFRVRIWMFWYSPNGAVVTGRATNEVDWYRKVYHSVDFGDDVRTLHNFCPDYYPG